MAFMQTVRLRRLIHHGASIMPTRTCSWATCKSDSRLVNHAAMKGVTFNCFPDPRTSEADCAQWIRACCRPHSRLNIQKISADFLKPKYNRYFFVCSKHFPDCRLTLASKTSSNTACGLFCFIIVRNAGTSSPFSIPGGRGLKSSVGRAEPVVIPSALLTSRSTITNG